MSWFLWIILSILLTPVIMMSIGIICIGISTFIEWCNVIRKDR